jgi:hypothetical protein
MEARSRLAVTPFDVEGPVGGVDLGFLAESSGDDDAGLGLEPGGVEQPFGGAEHGDLGAGDGGPFDGLVAQLGGGDLFDVEEVAADPLGDRRPGEELADVEDGPTGEEGELPDL